MQAYANAKLTPSASQLRLAPVPSAEQAVGVDVNRGHAAADCAATAPSILASLMLDGLDDHGLAVLAGRLLPHLRRTRDAEPARSNAAYTVASLAAELGVSQKTIRCAIARRELSAVNRGSRWIISVDAVRAWAAASDGRRRTRRGCAAGTPKAAGPSLRSVLCHEASRGGGR